MAWREDALFGRVRLTKGLRGACVTIPTTGTPGYMAGERVFLKNPVLGQSSEWINQGSITSCLFVPFGPVQGYGIVHAGARGATTGSTTEVISGEFANTDIAFAGHVKSDDTDTIASVIVTDDESEILITGSADPLSAHGYLWGALRNKCTPNWDIAFAGQAASTAATSTAITVTGVLATDIGLSGYGVTDDTDTIAKTVCTADTVTTTHSTTSSTGHTINYAVLRQRGTFKPSHYVAFAGKDVATTADASGIATNDVAITGLLATDLPFAFISVQGGTIRVARASCVAGTLTVQFSADPSTTSSFSYFVLRAY